MNQEEWEDGAEEAEEAVAAVVAVTAVAMMAGVAASMVMRGERRESTIPHTSWRGRGTEERGGGSAPHRAFKTVLCNGLIT
jgi:hypothetical protein